MGRIGDVLHGGGTGSKGCVLCCKDIEAVVGGDRFCDDLMGDHRKKWGSLSLRSWLNGGEWLPVLPFDWGERRVALVAVEPMS